MSNGLKTPFAKKVILIIYVTIVCIGFIWNCLSLTSLSYKCYERADDCSRDIPPQPAKAANSTEITRQHNAHDNITNEKGESKTDLRDAELRKCFISAPLLFNFGLFCVYCLCFVLMCVSFSLRFCLPSGQQKYRAPIADIDQSIIPDLIDNKLIKPIDIVSDSTEYHAVQCLIQNTWQYRGQDRLGKDSRALTHNGVKIKKILKVTNQNGMQIYQREKLMMNNKTVCDELKKKPILTEKSKIFEACQVDTDVVTTIQQPEKTLCLIKLKLLKLFCFRQKETEVDIEKNESETTSQLLTPPSEEEIAAHVKKHLHRDETYLFHGTKITNLEGIAQNGFNHDKHCKKALYGKAIYLAESSEKADQYCDPINERRSNDLTMLVVRVLLGKIDCHTEDTPPKAPYRGVVGFRSTSCDSFVTAISKRFREFLVYDARQCYPEYIVQYDRLYDASIKPGKPKNRNPSTK